MMNDWFEIDNEDQILSPALLFYPERIRNNIQKMIRIAGSLDRLRPHIKTYKCREIVEMQMEAGISRFKCATLAEAYMLAVCGAPDVLLAYPLVGPNQRMFARLASQYPETSFSTLVDHLDQLRQWRQHLEEPVNLYVDLDVGMHRTGVSVAGLRELLNALEAEKFNLLGFHAYDGHIRDKNPEDRKEHVNQSFREAEKFLEAFDGPKTFITGGSITFPIHAEKPSRTLSPGTTLLWDQGYDESFPDIDFDIAATLLGRVVSKPGRDLLCLDLGHKAVASEMKEHLPVYFPQIPDCELFKLSEEHFVIETKDAGNWKTGDTVYGFPWHICPTVALHSKAGVVNDRRVQNFWEITSRNRMYFLD